MDQEFVADDVHVYGFSGPAQDRVLIATAESPTWAKTIADLLTRDPDAYVV